MQKTWIVANAALVLGLMATPATATGSILNETFQSGFGGALGRNREALGQIFYADAGTTLDSFEFFVANNGLPTNLQARVYGWSGVAAQGPLLFAGPTVSTAALGFNSYGWVKFNLNRTVLPNSGQYVMVITNDAVVRVGDQLSVGANVNGYTSGYLLRKFNSDLDTEEFLRTPWWNPNPEVVADLVFRLNVASVPEPSSWAMLIAGFGLTGAAARRRRAALA